VSHSSFCSGRTFLLRKSIFYPSRPKLMGVSFVELAASVAVTRLLERDISSTFVRRYTSRLSCITVLVLILTSVCDVTIAGVASPSASPQRLAGTPPMGWNDWAHYQCAFNAQAILNNARELVKTGLAARGYKTVTIDDCWMEKDRDPRGNLQVSLQRFPHGMKPVARAVHALGLKFGIYEAAGYATCDGLAASGEPKGGGKDHFVQDASLFASWGVDYLKLDGCHFYVPEGTTKRAAYQRAYAAERAALKSTGRPIIFSESAPAYFRGTPYWYDVLTWVRNYGQLWREGSDMANFRATDPDRSRFYSVLWNYAYNLPLGRFQKPGNWNDPDFIIAGDKGMSLAESRSQLALWSMMSAPLILSSDIEKLSPQSIAILGNRAVIAVDQDSLGRMATLVRRSAVLDVLLKPLSNGDDAVAVLNHGDTPVRVNLRPTGFGFAASSECRLDTQDLWTGRRQSAVSALRVEVATHDTAIWRIRPSASCGRPERTGTIITTKPERDQYGLDGYTRCLSTSGRVGICLGGAGESWTVTSLGALRSSDGRCLAVAKGQPVLEACLHASDQRWRYTLKGNLIAPTTHRCLSTVGPDSEPQILQMQPCGHNQANQIWAMPN
jgi:alpha-galactosidase